MLALALRVRRKALQSVAVEFDYISTARAGCFMSDFLTKTIGKAKADRQTIVLPEGSDIRTLKAAREIIDQGIADVIILGSESDMRTHGVGLDGATIIDPATSDKFEAYAEKFAELRAKKGVTLEQAREQMLDVSYFGVMMVYLGDADGMVSGACHSTADTLRPALQILRTAPGTKLVSSSFVMDVPDCEYGDGGLFVMGDCALNMYPTADELSEIAIASAHTFERLCGGTARVALLSYSSYGSGKGESVDKVHEATQIAKEKAPDLQVDGELQADAAIVASVGSLKAPESPVAGKANVLVFPDLDAANIGYKLVQRLAKAEAYGPITQGLGAPMNDLSRGCSAEDVLGVIAITAVQAQEA